MRNEILIFFIVFFSCAVTINSKNQYDFNLQQIGVEAMAERSTSALEGSKAPELQPLGDTFNFNNHIYAVKQPGQFIVGAFFYKILSFFGVSYEINFLWAASLVTLFTSGIFTALLCVCMYMCFKKITHDEKFSFASSLVFYFSSAFLPYSGVSHHDVIAAAVIFSAFTIIFTQGARNNYRPLAFLAGFLVSLTFLFSMLPLLVCFAVLVYGVYKSRDFLLFLLGFCLGCYPVFIYNTALFSSPFLFPNTVSAVGDTTPYYNIQNFIDKFSFYLWDYNSSIFYFSPIILFAVFGLFCVGRQYRKEVLLVTMAALLHMLYISSIDTVGHAQYGPRYLIPILPFLYLGLSGIYNLRSYSRVVASIGIFLSAVISIFIQVLGSLQGVMYHSINVHPVKEYWMKTISGDIPAHPLLIVGLIELLFVIIYAYFFRCAKCIVELEKVKPNR